MRTRTCPSRRGEQDDRANVAVASPPLWRRLIGFNLLTGIVLGVGGWYVGWFGAHAIVGPSIDYFGDIDYNELSVFLAYIGGVVGFLVGLGFLNYPIRALLGYPPSLREKETHGWSRYFGLCTDHKVVGIQYLWGIGLFFFIGGLNAMLIRTELLSPHHQIFPAGTYLTIVGMHGTMMMGMMSSAILGPFANYLIPIMIGARRMAFPRIEALTFWLLMAAGAILTTTVFFGGFPTGWTGYAPLQTQANPGMDNYILFFALVGVSMTLLGLNMIATILTMRAPGLTWTRLPIFVWGVLSTAVLMVLAAPVLIATLGMGRSGPDGADARSSTLPPAAATTCTRTCSGSSATRRCTSSPCRASRSSSSSCPCSRASRSGATGSRSSGLLGVSLLSWFVWQHHLFVSGINGDLRPFYMLSTELISIPTGFTFLCGMMTIWRGHIRFTVPMLFCLAWFFNFLHRRALGRLPLRRAERRDDARQLLLDGALPLHDHGRPRLHVLRGDLLLGAEDDRLGAERAAREDPLLDDVRLLQLDVRAALRGRLPRPAAPRRHLCERPPVPQRLGVSISAFLLGLSMLVFLFNLVWSLAFVKKPAAANPWASRSIEFQLPSPVPVHNFDRIPVFSSDPYGYGEGPVPSLVPAGRAGRKGVNRRWPSRSHTKAPATRSSSRSRPSCSAATSSRRATCWPARRRSSSSPSSSPTSISAR